MQLAKLKVCMVGLLALILTTLSLAAVGKAKVSNSQPHIITGKVNINLGNLPPGSKIRALTIVPITNSNASLVNRTYRVAIPNVAGMNLTGGIQIYFMANSKNYSCIFTFKTNGSSGYTSVKATRYETSSNVSCYISGSKASPVLNVVPQQ